MLLSFVHDRLQKSKQSGFNISKANHLKTREFLTHLSKRCIG